MTTEIAVLNREAVALAADSAVTIVGESGLRVFESAQKLFPLSEKEPVGAMVYNNASFMGIPWETIIGICRAKIGTGKRNTLNEYAQEAIGVLNDLVLSIPGSAQEEYFDRVLRSAFGQICRDIEVNMQREQGMQKAKGVTVEGARKRTIVARVVDGYSKRLSGAATTAGVPPNFDRNIDAAYGDLAQEIAADVFESNGIRTVKSGKVGVQLRQIGTGLFSKDTEGIFADEEYTGLVLAGFGEKELFPSVITFHIRGTLRGVLIYRQRSDQSHSVDFDSSAGIVPFAQIDVIDTFKYGIRPDFEERIQVRLRGLSQRTFTRFMTSVSKLLGQPNQMTSLTQKLANGSVGHFLDIWLDFKESIQADKQKADRDLEDLISVLPKSELAQMARTLVSFTCFYRKFRGQEVTVREPVDVAVISKSEGFVWIERKSTSVKV